MIPFLILVILSAIGAVTAWVEFHEVDSNVEVLNPKGDTGTALLVYQKGLLNFQVKAAYAFADGLVSSGWRVEITTVSHRTPTDISRYDLLILGWPTYWFSPSRSIKRYINRIGDLERKNTVIICTAAGAPAGSCKQMKHLVQAANGTVVNTLTLFTIRPNEGNSDHIDIALKSERVSPCPRGVTSL